MRTLKSIAVAALITISGASFSQSASMADPGMMMTLKQLYPATTFKEVSRTTVPGIFEVVMGQNIAYVDQSGRYFFFGRLFDMQKQQDMTASKLEDSSKIDTATLPLNDAIKTVKGNGSRTFYVFSDPDCPYCKQLEQNLLGMSDVTIYTFLMPLEGLHPQAKGKSIAVWCASDKVKAWDELMQKGIVPTTSSCSHPVDRNLALAERFGISGTPTLISPDGRKLPGAAPAGRIAQWLEAGKVAAQ